MKKWTGLCVVLSALVFGCGGSDGGDDQPAGEGTAGAESSVPAAEQEHCAGGFVAGVGGPDQVCAAMIGGCCYETTDAACAAMSCGGGCNVDDAMPAQVTCQ